MGRAGKSFSETTEQQVSRRSTRSSIMTSQENCGPTKVEVENTKPLRRTQTKVRASVSGETEVSAAKASGLKEAKKNPKTERPRRTRSAGTNVDPEPAKPAEEKVVVEAAEVSKRARRTLRNSGAASKDATVKQSESADSVETPKPMQARRAKKVQDEEVNDAETAGFDDEDYNDEEVQFRTPKTPRGTALEMLTRDMPEVEVANVPVHTTRHGSLWSPVYSNQNKSRMLSRVSRSWLITVFFLFVAAACGVAVYSEIISFGNSLPKVPTLMAPGAKVCKGPSCQRRPEYGGKVRERS